jgi:hypothetical protein
MAYTLGQASKATGKSKTAIAQALTEGRLSGTKDEKGRWQIEPAELHRLYPKLDSHVDEKGHLPDTEKEEIARLKATVEGLERLCRQIEGERDRAVEQNIRLTALLPSPAAQSKARSWWPFRKRESA